MEIHDGKLLIHKEAIKPSFKSVLKILTTSSDLNNKLLSYFKNTEIAHISY